MSVFVDPFWKMKKALKLVPCFNVGVLTVKEMVP